MLAEIALTVIFGSAGFLTAPRNVQAVELPPLEVIEIVDAKQYAEIYFARTPVLIKVGWCESRLRHFESSGRVLRGKVNSSDVGIMQINERFHGETAMEMGLNIYSVEGNLKYAEHLYKTQGLRPWNASKTCWSPEPSG